MGFYDQRILPHFLHFACGMKPNMKQREKVVHRAQGVVLEVGIGSGLNLPFYDANRVTKILGLDPSVEITRIAGKAIEESPIDVEIIHLPGEEIPLEDNSVDTVLFTYTLCSIPDTETALRNMRRVLKPGGELLFCEHGAAPDAGVKKWQDRINPTWGKLAGGCHLNRDIPALIGQGGFNTTDLKAHYIPGPRFLTYNYWGSASG